MIQLINPLTDLADGRRALSGRLAAYHWFAHKFGAEDRVPGSPLMYPQLVEFSNTGATKVISEARLWTKAVGSCARRRGCQQKTACSSCLVCTGDHRYMCPMCLGGFSLHIDDISSCRCNWLMAAPKSKLRGGQALSTCRPGPTDHL